MLAYSTFQYSNHYHVNRCASWICLVSLTWLSIMYLESLMLSLILCHIILTLLLLLSHLSLVYWLRFVRLRQLLLVTLGNSSRKWKVLVSKVLYSVMVFYTTHEVGIKSVWWSLRMQGYEQTCYSSSTMSLVVGIFVYIACLKVPMPLLDYSQHALVAPNTGMLCNTHTIMYASEQYMFCTPGL